MINKNEFDILVRLASGKSISQRDIARQTGISLGGVNSIVRELNLKGLADGTSVTESGLKSLEPYRVKNAVILAAGLSSRFAPFSYEKPKGLLTVKGDVLIERQIRQLHEAGITDITVVVGYMAELFFYLEDVFGVKIVVNPEYAVKNNVSSVYRVLDRLGNTYICSSDNYFVKNPFEQFVYSSYYSAVYEEGETKEWCIQTKGKERRITGVTVGGRDSWVMLGHVYWDAQFSQAFSRIVESEYPKPATDGKLWEELFVEHIKDLPMVMRPYSKDDIREFDSVADMRSFDPEFISNVSSEILDNILSVLGGGRADLSDFYPLKAGITNLSFHFSLKGVEYVYRHPGVGTENMIDRVNEVEALELARDLGLDSTFIYADPEHGWKISHFIPNAQTLDPHNPSQLADAMQMAHRLHKSDACLKTFFDFIDASVEYEAIIRDCHAEQPKGYGQLRDKVMRLKKLADADMHNVCVSHNDFFEYNLLLNEQGDISLIDWEYAGMSDEANDFGTFCVCCKLSEEEIEFALKAYLGREATPEEHRHYWAYVVFAGWCWYVWALAKEAQGDNTGEWLYIYYSYAKKYVDQVLGWYEVSAC